MPVSRTSLRTGANPQPVIAQYVGIFHGAKEAHFAQIIKSAPFAACNLLILAWVHSVEGPEGIFTAQFTNGRDNDCPKAGPGADLERVALVVHLARAQNPGIKILVSLGYDPGDLLNAAKSPSQFADSVAKLVQDHGLDGFDIDYENVGGVTPDEVVDLVNAVKQSLSRVTPKRDMILTLAPAVGEHPDKQVMELFTYVMPQYYDGVPPKDEDWYANQLGSFDQIVYGLDSELPPYKDPVAYALPARVNGAAGLFGWRLDNDDLFVYATKMRRLMANGVLLSTTADTTGPWQWSPIPTLDQPASWVDVSCAGAGSGLQTVAVGSDFGLWITTYVGNGKWLPMYDVKQFVSGGPPAFSRVACGSADSKSLQVVGLGSDGGIYLAIRHPDTTWNHEFSKAPLLTGSDAIVDIACAGSEQGVHVVAINEQKFLWLTTWHLDNNTWDAFTAVPLEEGQPWTFAHVACATTPEGLHLIACGQVPLPTPLPSPLPPPDPRVVLWHRVRDASGNWQPYQKVMDLEASCPTLVVYAACVSTQEGLHVVAAAADYSLWHSIRGADGKWQPFQCVGTNARPNFVGLACGTWAEESFQVVSVRAA
jgi:hypothetical protein